jgi:[ribosomal protein S5]-alanine N-acetyltransferase
VTGGVPFSFETARLTASRPGWDDLDDLFVLFTTPAVMRTLSADGKPRSRAGTVQGLGRTLAHWSRHGFGPWMFRDGGGRFVGYCGLRYVLIEGVEEVEILYAAMPAFWKQGLAAEMARASLEQGAGAIGVGSVVGFTLPWNRPSRNVLERCGFTYERRIVHASLPHVLYRRVTPRSISPASSPTLF